MLLSQISYHFLLVVQVALFSGVFSPLMILQFFVPFQPFFALHSCYFCPFPSGLGYFRLIFISIGHDLFQSISVWFLLAQWSILHRYMNYFSIRLYVIHDHQLCCGLMSCSSIAPKWFWTVQIIMVEYQSFWSGPNRFGRVQSILVRVKLDFSGLIFIIWTWPKWFRPDQNKLWY